MPEWVQKIEGFPTLTAKGVKTRNYRIHNKKRGSGHPEIKQKS